MARGFPYAAVSTGLVAILSAALPAEASFPGENGTIVVARPGQPLLALDPDGTDPRSLDAASSGATAPRWSPEGNRIAAVLNGDLVVLLATGRLLHTLTSTGDVVAEPSWSPDGRRIAYVRSNGELWVADARLPGEGSLLLPGPVVSAAWSPLPGDDRIAYTDGGGILTVRSDGSEAGTELMAADSRGRRGELAWNPSAVAAFGIAFTLTDSIGSTWVEGPGYAVSDGFANGEDRSPAWSPDGERLLFSRAGVACVYTPRFPPVPSFVQSLGVSGSGGSWQPRVVASTAAYEGDVSTGVLTQMSFRIQPLAGLLPVTVGYSTLAGSATDAANADFVPASGSVTTPTPNGWAATVSVPVVGDTDPEPDESFYVDFTFPSDPAAPLRVGGTILNDDGGRGRNGIITYAGFPGGMALDPGTRRSEQVLPGATDGLPPVYSPSGDLVAYAYFAAPRYFVVVAGRDGSIRTRFDSPGGFPENLVWSPDGARLLWTEEMTLYVADPSNAHPILILPDVSGASWSNDTAGPRRLAYSRVVIGQTLVQEVWVVREDGSGQTLLASDATVAEWSPDGTTIAFYGVNGVWLMNADGSNPRFIVPDGELFRWSPGSLGSSRFVVRRDDGRLVVRGEATPPETLVPTPPTSVLDIQWSPDGQQLVLEAVDPVARGPFSSGNQLWIVGPDDAGTPFARLDQVTTLTTSAYDSATTPRWSTAPHRPSANLEGGSGFEGGQAQSVVRLDAPASEPVTVGFRWYDGTALVDQDYAAPPSNAVTLAPGETEVPIVWSLLPDPIAEGDETFGVELLASTSSTRIGTPSTALVRIVDVPPPAPLQVSISDASVAEGNGGTSPLTFLVTLTGTPSGPVDVQFATSDGTATLAGLDYQAASGVITLSAASPSRTVTVLVSGDRTVEPDESLVVTLSTASGGAAIADSQGVGTIRNDDNAPVLNPIGDLGARPELAPITFTASATDADGDAVSYSLVGNLPSAAAIDATSGTFAWIPTEAQGPAAYGFGVRAQDGFGNFSDQPVTVTVTEVNAAPVLSVTGVPAAPVDPGTPVSFTASALDTDLPANNLSFTLVGAPAGASIGLTSGVFVWTPLATQAGSHTFQVVAFDDGVPALSAAQAVTIEVSAPPPPGGGESVSQTFGGGGGTLTTDVEGDGATPSDPIETDVTTPVAGAVAIVEPPLGAPPPPTAWDFLGYSVSVMAPAASVANPLRLRFVLDASVAGPGGAPALAVFRNGVEVGACTGAPQAVPDPCVASRQSLPDGDAELVILTSRASEWRFGTPRVTAGLAYAAARPATGGAVSLSAFSRDGRPLGYLLYVDGTDWLLSARLTAFGVDSGGRSAWIAGVGYCGRRFLAYVEDSGARAGRLRLWVDGVDKTGDGTLWSGVVLVRP